MSAANSDAYREYRERYLNAPRLDLKAPVDISLELSSLCNMACSYCYHNDKKNLPFSQRYMRPDTVKALLNQAAEAGVNSVKFNWRGESTMNPWFTGATSWAKNLASGSVFIDRITNSNFKFDTNRDEIFKGLAYQTKVKVSYDSFRPEVFEKQRYLGDHALTTANVDKFYNWPGRTTQIVIQAVRTKLNADEDLEGALKKRWPAATLSVRDMVEGRVDRDLAGVAHRRRNYANRQSCIQAHARLIFDWDGTAVACCPDIKQEIKLGNIRETTLLEIFNSEKARELRKSLLNKTAFLLDPCKNCSSFETFEGFNPSWDS